MCIFNMSKIKFRRLYSSIYDQYVIDPYTKTKIYQYPYSRIDNTTIKLNLEDSIDKSYIRNINSSKTTIFFNYNYNSLLSKYEFNGGYSEPVKYIRKYINDWDELNQYANLYFDLDNNELHFVIMSTIDTIYYNPRICNFFDDEEVKRFFVEKNIQK
jgi:hypothetical protein